jgi:hypothetical protein
VGSDYAAEGTEVAGESFALLPGVTAGELWAAVRTRSLDIVQCSGLRQVP